MSIRDYDPLLKRKSEANKKAGKPKQAASNRRFTSRNAGVISLGMGVKSWKTSDVSSAAELGRALRPIFDEIAVDFRNYCRSLEDYLPSDLAQALEPTLQLSLTYVPRDTGELADSAYLSVENFRNGARVEMGYGKGGKPDYAIYVHEIPYAHASPTSWKFLERAINEDYLNIVQRVSLNFRTRLGGR